MGQAENVSCTWHTSHVQQQHPREIDHALWVPGPATATMGCSGRQGISCGAAGVVVSMAALLPCCHGGWDAASCDCGVECSGGQALSAGCHHPSLRNDSQGVHPGLDSQPPWPSEAVPGQQLEQSGADEGAAMQLHCGALGQGDHPSVWPATWAPKGSVLPPAPPCAQQCIRGQLNLQTPSFAGAQFL